MQETATFTQQNTTHSLAQARALALPSRQEMLQRAPSVQAFWDSNQQLLEDAWQEWELAEKDRLVIPDESLLDKRLRDTVNQAWQDPATESAVQSLWEEAAPGVFKTQFFDPARLTDLRHYLDAVANADIPVRPPYGIVLNRRGAMLDPRSEGYIAAPGFQNFYRQLFDKYLRPVARLLFPEVMGYDTQTFGFSIQWQAGMDTSLRLHTDASAVTINLNMNLPGETFTGSEVDFYDPTTRQVTRLSFEPGSATIHRGSVAHASQPITSGTRSNMVLWLYGDRMQIPRHNIQPAAVDAKARWTLPVSQPDRFAPF